MQDNFSTMANVVHYYYPTPTVHHHPKNGMIKIGNILADFTTPEEPVALAPAFPPPSSDPQTDDVRDVVEYGGPSEKLKNQPTSAPSAPDSIPSQSVTESSTPVTPVKTSAAEESTQPTKPSQWKGVFKIFGGTKAKIKPNLPSRTTISWQKTVTISTTHLRSKGLGVYARVTGIGGGNINLNWTEDHDKVFDFERVVTVEFWPSYEYIDTCLATKDIDNILRLTNYKPLYLITGIKTVAGAKAHSEDSKTTSVEGSGELDASGMSGGAAPMQGGLNAGKAKEDTLGVSYGSSSDFVFAFRVKKITVCRKTKEAMMENMTKGTLLDEQQRPVPLSFEIEDINDALPNDLGCVGHIDADDVDDAIVGA